jgi:transcriptional regulator with XRE-family HTH domain
MPAPKVTKEERCYWEIKSAMDSKRLNQTKLAKRLGTSQSSVSGYMRNIYIVEPTKILLMSDILGVSIFDIMTKHWKEG